MVHKDSRDGDTALTDKVKCTLCSQSLMIIQISQWKSINFWLSYNKKQDCSSAFESVYVCECTCIHLWTSAGGRWIDMLCSWLKKWWWCFSWLSDWLLDLLHSRNHLYDCLCRMAQPFTLWVASECPYISLWLWKKCQFFCFVNPSDYHWTGCQADLVNFIHSYVSCNTYYGHSNLSSIKFLCY